MRSNDKLDLSVIFWLNVGLCCTQPIPFNSPHLGSDCLTIYISASCSQLIGAGFWLTHSQIFRALKSTQSPLQPSFRLHFTNPFIASCSHLFWAGFGLTHLPFWAIYLGWFGLFVVCLVGGIQVWIRAFVCWKIQLKIKRECEQFW